MTINEVTYGYINGATESFPIKSVRHDIGFIFASVLWDLHCYLSKVDGWNYDKYNPDIGGNNKAFQLVVEGLKVQPCKPNFIDSRDAILKADENLYDGRYKCMIWQIFARRGLGHRAISNTGYAGVNVEESFTIPSNVKDCPTLGNDGWWLHSSEILDLLLSEAPSLDAAKVLDSLAFDWIVNDAYTNNMLDNIQEDTSKYLLERYVLAVLAYDTNIDTWSSHYDFLNRYKSHCDWNMIFNIVVTYGVVCDDDGFVDKLHIRGTNLIGTLPTELVFLSNITFLELGNNKFTGTLPSEFGNFDNLIHWSMQYNKLTGTLPTELVKLTRLAILNLRYNLFTGTIPTEFGNLASITTLDLGNQLTGTIPTELGNLSTLVNLFLGVSPLTGTIPTEFGNLVRLNNLDLADIGFLTGTIPTELGRLTDLHRFIAGDNQLTGTIPTGLTSSSRLWYVAIQDNQLTGTVPTKFGSMPKLRTFHIDRNNLTGDIDSLFCTGGHPSLNLQPVRIDCDELYCTCCADTNGIPCVPWD